GKFLQADTIVPEPGNPQSFNRYSYVLNNPLKYTDPTGHFTEEAISQYLIDTYGDKAGEIWAEWYNNKEWWDMLLAAEGDDTLILQVRDQTFTYTFQGSGQDSLTGIAFAEGRVSDKYKSLTMEDIARDDTKPFAWVGLLRWQREGRYNTPVFPHIRDGYELVEWTHKSGWIQYGFPLATAAVDAAIGCMVAVYVPAAIVLPTIGGSALVSNFAVSPAMGNVQSQMNMTSDDVTVYIAPTGASRIGALRPRRSAHLSFRFNDWDGSGWTRTR
nr:hypothetical protein [Ardenticatenales bacterium]